jgi:hypothetical protein
MTRVNTSSSVSFNESVNDSTDVTRKVNDSDPHRKFSENVEDQYTNSQCLPTLVDNVSITDPLADDPDSSVSTRSVNDAIIDDHISMYR